MGELVSLEKKRIHLCTWCYGLGGYKATKNGKFQHKACGKVYSLDEWMNLPTVEVPAWRVVVPPIRDGRGLHG